MARRVKPAIVEEHVPPITDADVDQLWRYASKRGPYPTQDACAQLAELLNDLRLHGAAVHIITQDRRVIDAVNLLLRFIAGCLDPIEKDGIVPPPPRRLGVAALNRLVALRDALLDARPVLSPMSAPAHHVSGPRVPPAEPEAAAIWFAEETELRALQRRVGLDTVQAPPWEQCALAVWFLATASLRAMGRAAGIGANSVAVRFGVAATRRLGFPGITENALAKRLRKRPS